MNTQGTIQRLSDPDWEVVLAAAKQLASDQDLAALGPMHAAYERAMDQPLDPDRPDYWAELHVLVSALEVANIEQDPILMSLRAPKLREPQRSALLQGGERLTQKLRELVQRRYHHFEDSILGGRAPSRAADLLVQMQDAESVPALLHGMASASIEEMAWDVYIQALTALAPLNSEPLLKVAESDPDPNQREGAIEALVNSGVKDPRLLKALKRGLRQDKPTLFACYLATYGDPAALPAIRHAFAKAAAHPKDGLIMMNEFGQAILDLGGAPTALEVAILERANRELNTQIEERAAERRLEELARRKPSRNAMCPCGSGKKYKRCHGR